MDARDLLRRRLSNQLLSATSATNRPPANAADVVGRLGALQAQDYGLAKWSVGQRADGLTDADLDAALAHGTILRITSGGLADRQHTYALLDERVPAGAAPDADEALATLTRRYFAGHGPATADDLAWWASLTLAQARRGIALASDSLERTDIDGLACWTAAADPSPDRPSDFPPTGTPTVHLLQAFDELIVGYRRTRSVASLNPNSFVHPIIVDGEFAGSWRRVRSGADTSVETTLFRRLTHAEQSSLAAAIARHAEFIAPG